MGSKPSNNFQSDRPESGGANRDEEREKSGLLEREKEEFSTAESKRWSKWTAPQDHRSGKPEPHPND